MKWKKIQNVDIFALYIPKRLQHIKNIMDKLHLDNAQYIQGPNKKNLNLSQLVKNNIVTHKYAIEKNRGKIACHLGHIDILKLFLQSNNDYALIFEDDIIVADGNYNKNNKNIHKIIKNIPKDADVIYLDYCWERCNEIIPYNDLFSVGNKPLCRHMYMVSKNGAQKIINETLPMYYIGDDMISDLTRNKRLKTYIVNPEIITIKQDKTLFGSKLDNHLPQFKCMPNHASL